MLCYTLQYLRQKVKITSESKFQNDLTQGSVAKNLIRFAMPFLLSMLIQQSYSMADLLIVSHFAGEASVAGVNNGGQLTFFVTAIAIGVSVGGTILIGQYFGAKKMEDLRKTASTLLTMMILSSIVMAVIFIMLSETLLGLLQVPEESVSEAWIYLVICMFGLPFIFMYNAIAGILRGMGDAKRPLIIIAIGSVVSAALNFLLVGYFRLDAAGAAIATVAAQAGCVIVSAIYLAKSGFFFDFKPKSFVIHRDKLRAILRLGIPSAISQVAVNLSFLLLTVLVNRYGVYVAAAAGLSGRFNGFIIMPVIAISSSISMICAQNLGAGLYDRALKTMKIGIVLSYAISIPFFIFVMLYPDFIMSLMSSSEAVIDAGEIYLRAIAWDYLLVPLTFSFFGLATGAGHTHITMINTFITSVALRVPTALLLSITFDLGLFGVGLSVPIATLGAMVFLFMYVMSGRWKSVAINRS